MRYAISGNGVQPDNEWFTYRIVVQGKTVQTYINDMLAAEYTEPDETLEA